MDATIKKIITENNLSVIYDIGAHNGNFSRQIFDNFKSADVFMFEANPQKSQPRWSLGKYKWFNVVLSDQQQIVKFYYNNGTGDSYYLENTRHYSEDKFKLVSTDTLNNVANENQLPAPEFIKIDTQGSELDILSQTDLSNCAAVFCEVPAVNQVYNHGAPTHEQYVNFFKQHGFNHKKLVKDHVKQNVVLQHDIIFSKMAI